MRLEENKQVVREFCNAIGSQDYEKIANLFSKNVRVWAAGDCFFSGEWNYDEFFEACERLFPVFEKHGFKFVVKDMTAEGNRVAAELESRAIHNDGTPYENSYHFLFVIDDDGKIVEYKEYMDTKYAAEIIGWKEPNVTHVRHLGFVDNAMEDK